MNKRTTPKKRPKPTGQFVLSPKPLKSVKVGSRTLPVYDSLLEVLGIDPATEPADRPKTVSVKRAQELTGLGERLIWRMIAAGRGAGRQAQAENPETASA